MSDKVHPATKPATVNGGANPPNKLPPTKAQLYNHPAYKPKPPPKRRRSCCCSCCLITTFIIITLLLLIAISGAVLWVIYRPHRPNFTVSSIKVSQFNLTSTNYNSEFNFTFNARNPNKKIKFFYQPITISAFSDDINIAGGSLPDFMLDTKNTTTMKAVIVGQNVGEGDISTLQSNLKKKNSLPLKIQMDTKVQAKIGSLKTKKVRVRIICDGAKLNVPGGKVAPSVATADLKCKVDLRFKIWKWTV